MQVYIWIGLTFLYLSFLIHFQLWKYLWKATLVKHHQGSYFFWCRFSIKYHGCIGDKINTILYDRYYLQKFKVITSSHAKYKKPNVQIIFIFSDWILIKKIIAYSLHPFLLLGETDLRKIATWGNELFPSA